MFRTQKIFIIGVLFMAFTNGCSITNSNHIQEKERSNQEVSSSGIAFDGKDIMQKMSIGEHINMFWKFFFEKGEKVPTEPLPQERVDLSALFDGGPRGLKSAWLGHSSLLINIDGYSILTDPVFERKVTVVGPTRFNTELPLEIDDLPSVDVVIISHNHYDHLNKYSVRQLKEKVTVFLVPVGVGPLLKKWGVPEEKIVEMNWWDEVEPVEGLRIAATPSQHFSGRGVFDKNKSLWASWVIQSADNRVFFSGDSGYFDGFKEIGRKYGPFDVAFLECGAYNERWSAVHMMPEETVQAFLDLKGKMLQPIHWATYNLAFHAWYEPIERLTSEAWNRGAPVSSPIIGQVVDYQKDTTANLWWLPAMERSRGNNQSPELAVDLGQ